MHKINPTGSQFPNAGQHAVAIASHSGSPLQMGFRKAMHCPCCFLQSSLTSHFFLFLCLFSASAEDDPLSPASPTAPSVMNAARRVNPSNIAWLIILPCHYRRRCRSSFRRCRLIHHMSRPLRPHRQNGAISQGTVATGESHCLRRNTYEATATCRSSSHTPGAVWIRSDPGVAIARDLILLLDKTFTAVDAEADRGHREEDQQGENRDETRVGSSHAPFVRDAGPDWTGMQELRALAGADRGYPRHS